MKTRDDEIEDILILISSCLITYLIYIGLTSENFIRLNSSGWVIFSIISILFFVCLIKCGFYLVDKVANG